MLDLPKIQIMIFMAYLVMAPRTRAPISGRSKSRIPARRKISRVDSIGFSRSSPQDDGLGGAGGNLYDLPGHRLAVHEKRGHKAQERRCRFWGSPSIATKAARKCSGPAVANRSTGWRRWPLDRGLASGQLALPLRAREAPRPASTKLICSNDAGPRRYW